MSQGYVYFLRIVGVSEDIYKVGFTTNIRSRIQALQTACPFELELSHYILGTQDDEKRVHWLLRPYRLRGEWFSGDAHFFIWGTLECDTLDEQVVVPWVQAELDAINRYMELHPTLEDLVARGTVN